MAIQYTPCNQLNAATLLSELPSSCVLIKFCKCVKESLKYVRLFNSFARWFSEKRKKGLTFSYRFTGLESKKFSWNFCLLIHELLSIPNLTNSSEVKLHAMAFQALQLREAAALYSRVMLQEEQLGEMKTCCYEYFTTQCIFHDGANPTTWIIGYAIPYHVEQLFKESGYGLGLNTMQGREVKHIKLACYVENTCNVDKNQRWWTVFRHEYISLVWLRELDPYSVTYHCEEGEVSDSYVPNRVATQNPLYCFCGLQKSRSDDACTICSSNIMQPVKEVWLMVEQSRLY